LLHHTTITQFLIATNKQTNKQQQQQQQQQQRDYLGSITMMTIKVFATLVVALCVLHVAIADDVDNKAKLDESKAAWLELKPVGQDYCYFNISNTEPEVQVAVTVRNNNTLAEITSMKENGVLIELGIDDAAVTIDDWYDICANVCLNNIACHDCTAITNTHTTTKQPTTTTEQPNNQTTTTELQQPNSTHVPFSLLTRLYLCDDLISISIC
jgi:hypothetical protein